MLRGHSNPCSLFNALLFEQQHEQPLQDQGLLALAIFVVRMPITHLHILWQTALTSIRTRIGANEQQSSAPRLKETYIDLVPHGLLLLVCKPAAALGCIMRLLFRNHSVGDNAKRDRHAMNAKSMRRSVPLSNGWYVNDGMVCLQRHLCG